MGANSLILSLAMWILCFFAIFATGSSQSNCGSPLDVMFLQDTTGSFVDDLPNIRNQLPSLTATILDRHPGSHFGVAEFRDKPYFPLGMASDFCYKLDPAGSLSQDLSDFYWTYGGLIASGGGDVPEDVFQAIINVALDPAVSWYPVQEQSHLREGASEVGNRLLLVITDAPPHLPGDINHYNPELYPELPQGLPPNSGSITNGDVMYSCLHEDYPSPYQMRDAVKSAQINVMIITPEYANITGAWEWINTALLEQPDYFYQKEQDDSSDLTEAVIRVLDALSSECPSSTALPTSTPGEHSEPTSQETDTASQSTAGTRAPPQSPAATDMASETPPATLMPSATPDITYSLDATSVIFQTTPGQCLPCPPPCVPPCNPNACCNEEGMIIRIKDQPKEMILDVDF